MNAALEDQAKVDMLLRCMNDEDEEAAAEAAVRDLITQLIQIAAQAQAKIPPLPKDTKLEAISSLEGELRNTNDEIKNAETRYKEYDRNLNQVDQFISKLDPKDPAQSLAQVKAEIARLEGTPEDRERETDEIYKLLDEGLEDKARAKMDCLNAKNLQIGTLKDMVSVLENKKVMYNKEGERVTSFKDADFVVPTGKKIIKEGDNYYLLGEKEELSPNNKEAAQRAFKRAESEMQSVKNLVGANHGVEFNALNQEVSRISAQLGKLQEVSLTPLEDTQTAFDHGNLQAASTRQPSEKVLQPVEVDDPDYDGPTATV